jgi:hypothetical protein
MKAQYVDAAGGQEQGSYAFGHDQYLLTTLGQMAGSG